MAKRKKQRGQGKGHKLPSWQDSNYQSKSRFQVFEWPDRAWAKESWVKNTQDKGPGCFCFDATKEKDTPADVLIVVPVWLTFDKIEAIHPKLNTATKKYVNEANDRKDAAIAINLDYPTYQIIAIPFNHRIPCDLLFEAQAIDKD